MVRNQSKYKYSTKHIDRPDSQSRLRKSRERNSSMTPVPSSRRNRPFSPLSGEGGMETITPWNPADLGFIAANVYAIAQCSKTHTHTQRRIPEAKRVGRGCCREWKLSATAFGERFSVARTVASMPLDCNPLLSPLFYSCLLPQNSLFQYFQIVSSRCLSSGKSLSILCLAQNYIFILHCINLRYFDFPNIILKPFF